MTPTDEETIAWHREHARCARSATPYPHPRDELHHTRAAAAIEDLAATRRALDDALAMSGEAHEENARLRARVAELEATIETMKDDAQHAAWEADEYNDD